MSLFCVTGAFGYSGRFIAEELLAAGHQVRTLTGSMQRENPFGDQVAVFPLAFDDPEALGAALAGVDVLVNTYWVRFSEAGFSQSVAVENTRRLFEAAVAAGVGRVVHVSITNPSLDSPYEYFRGKARLEQALVAAGLPHSILRPAVFFGGPDILLNNIAWMLRRFPVVGVFGSGQYRIQPIHVVDFARLVVEESFAGGERVIDAIGPETFTYRELVETIGRAIGKRRMIVGLPPWLMLAFARVMGALLRDVLVTREEVLALMDGLLATESPPAGTTQLSGWLEQHARTLGRRYGNELARRRDRKREYARL